MTRFRARKIAKVAGRLALVLIALDLVATAATVAFGYKVLRP